MSSLCSPQYGAARRAEFLSLLALQVREVLVSSNFCNVAMSLADQNRRKHPRFKVRVPIEFRPEGSGTLVGATADLSLGGCYLEMMFTFPIGTMLDVSLQAGRTVRAKAVVVTRELQVGNGIKFIDMLPEDRDAIRNYMDTAIKVKSSEKKHPT